MVLGAAIIAAFLSGFFIRDLSAKKRSEPFSPILNTESKLAYKADVQSKKPEPSVIAPEMAQLNQVISQDCNPVVSSPDDVEFPGVRYQGKSAAELVVMVEDLLAQKKAVEEIQADDAYQQLMMLMQTEPAARQLVSERFLGVAGTPLGDLYTLAMASSGGAEEINSVATQLLRDGTRQQRLSALKILESSLQDSSTRAMVLNLLNNDKGADVQLSQAALSTLTRLGGIVSVAEQQEVVDTLTSYLHSPNPELRQTSLMLLGQWDRNGEITRKVYVDAAHDANPQVRAIAISGFAQGNFAFEDVRDTLLSSLQNPKEDINVRLAAQQVLQLYPLDEETIKILQASISKIPQAVAVDGTWHQTIVRE